MIRKSYKSLCDISFPSMLVSTNLHLIRTSWGQGLVLFSLWLFPQPSPLAPGLSTATCLAYCEDTHEHISSALRSPNCLPILTCSRVLSPCQPVPLVH